MFYISIYYIFVSKKDIKKPSKYHKTIIVLNHIKVVMNFKNKPSKLVKKQASVIRS